LADLILPILVQRRSHRFLSNLVSDKCAHPKMGRHCVVDVQQKVKLWGLNALAGWRKVEVSREQGLPQPGSDDP
jgi:hypothetical protein